MGRTVYDPDTVNLDTSEPGTHPMAKDHALTNREALSVLLYLEPECDDPDIRKILLIVQGAIATARQKSLLECLNTFAVQDQEVLAMTARINSLQKEHEEMTQS